MSLPIVFRRVAQTEFDEAALWYEAQKPGMSDEFIAEVERVVSAIADQPTSIQL